MQTRLIGFSRSGEQHSDGPRYRFFPLVAIIAAYLLAIPVGSGAEVVRLRSGNSGPGGTADTLIRFLMGPTDSYFGSTFKSENFDAARSGPYASITTVGSTWIQRLSTDTTAHWISTHPVSEEGHTALYAIDFEISCPFDSAQLTLTFAVDNRLGHGSNAGIFINQARIDTVVNGANAYPIGTYVSEGTLRRRVGSLLHTGTNTLYLYNYDFGALSGVLFSAEILTWAAGASPGVSPDPRGTFLRTSQDSAANNAHCVSLDALGVTGGQSLQLVRKGAFSFTLAGPQTGTAVLGVFSQDSALLPPEFLNRVPGALAAGTPYGTAPTFLGQLPTDIPEDFAFVDEIVVQVPYGAHYLFLSPDDSFYGDNEDPNGDFGVLISPLCGATTDVSPNPFGSSPLSLAIAPNPSHGRVGLSWRSIGSEPMEFRVFDIVGRLVHSWSTPSTWPGDGYQEIDLRGRPGGRAPGLLFVRLSQGAQSTVQRVVLLDN